jgi:DNA-binding NarL/FixJ family response regulator
VDDRNVSEISRTEWKVIQQVGYGRSNKEISSELSLSEGTVRNALSSILSKLDLRDRTQLAIWAVQTGVTTRNLDE